WCWAPSGWTSPRAPATSGCRGISVGAELRAWQAGSLREHLRMRILDRYLLREFLVYLVLGLLGFIVIFVVVDLIEKMDVFLDHKAPWPLVAQYFVNLAP